MTRRERVVVILEVLLAVGAFAGAVALITDAMDFGDLADHLPWGSMVLAGIALGVINGVFPTVVAVRAIRQPGTSRTWHILVGVALCVWIVVQVAIIGLGHWLQPFYFIWGVVIVVLAWRLPASD